MLDAWLASHRFSGLLSYEAILELSQACHCHSLCAHNTTATQPNTHYLFLHLIARTPTHKFPAPILSTTADFTLRAIFPHSVSILLFLGERKVNHLRARLRPSASLDSLSLSPGTNPLIDGGITFLMIPTSDCATHALSLSLRLMLYY